MTLLILLSVLFFVSEFTLTIVKRSKRSRVKQQSDKGSLMLMWIAITFGLTAGFNLANHQTWKTYNFLLAAAGILIYIAGTVIRWKAILQLKQSFTVDVAINREHSLITTGLYGHIRHPSYLGLLLIVAGLSVGMGSLLSLLVVVFPVFLATRYRIFIEERMLATEFGDPWNQYKTNTKMLLPGVY